MEETIKIIRGNSAVDATILTKDKAFEPIQKYFGCRLEEMAAIGDEVGDLPLLTKKGFKLVGAPANAQDRVKEQLIKQKNSYISSMESFYGFSDFYNKAIQEDIKLIISDKDGVLKKGGQMFGEKFHKLAIEMGKDKNPYVIILTGSSHNQNKTFMKEYKLNECLGENSKIKDYPWLLLAENGAIHINVLTGKTRNYIDSLCPDLLKHLKKDFEPKVKTRLEKKVLPKFNLTLSYEYEDQVAKVYHIKDKQSMVTFNIPLTFANGNLYRRSPEAEQLRDSIVEVMQNTLEELILPYEIL